MRQREIPKTKKAGDADLFPFAALPCQYIRGQRFSANSDRNTSASPRLSMLNDQFVMPHMASDCGYFKPWKPSLRLTAIDGPRVGPNSLFDGKRRSPGWNCIVAG
ncbi:hypothetical protein BLJAPNOD_01508 [Ensifer sp. M14]|nr:hypothetical protein BLJAPNOD_01508 [Ensifer sp. M14]